MAKQTKTSDGAPRKRGRTHLTEADKAHMAQRRTEAANEKKDALTAVTSNPQFRNPKFWGMVDPAVSAAVVDAIRKGGDKARQAKVAELKAELAKLESQPQE